MTEQEFQAEYERGYSVGKYHGFKEGEKVGYEKAQQELHDKMVTAFERMPAIIQAFTEHLTKGDAHGDQESDQG
jgi:flagellar biosynthesis/type III secretory pathway protein FliH